MNRLNTIFLLVAFPFTLFAGEQVSRSLPADPASGVELSVVRGLVSISGWDQPSVQVEGTLDDHAEELRFERDGAGITLEVRLARGARGGKGSQLTVHVPRASRLEVNGVSTDFSITETRSIVEVQTVSGDLQLKELAGAVAADSISGDISISATAGDVDANSVSGDIMVEAQGRICELATVSGDVRLTGLTLDRLDVATVSGNIGIQSGLSGTAVVGLESVSGDIALTLKDEINARFDLETGPGGDIRNGISDTKPLRETLTGAEALSFAAGSGGGRIKMETFSGNLSISR